MNVPSRRTVTALLAVGLVVVGQWLGPLPASGQPTGTPVRAGTHVSAGTPVPLIYDSDMDFDDASTLALLCEEHKLGRIDLRAVTVANNGFGEPHRALTHARSVLTQCGMPQVPTADGATGAGVHPAPPELVSTIETVLTGALGDADQPTPTSRWTAAQLIALAAGTAPGKVVVLATGPLTNVADALASGRVRERIARIHVMGGALAVPGNLYGSALPGFDNSQEFNLWMDPASAQRMLTRARPGSVRLVPLDATRFVPITPAFVSRLGAEQEAPGARIAYRIASQPDLAALIDLGIMYWWDALAAVSVVHDGIVTASRTVPVSIVQTGEQSGRTVTTRPGVPVRAAFEADRAAFEEVFLDSLNGRR